MTPAEADALHRSSVVVDTHADTPQRFVDEVWDFVTSPLGRGHLNLAAARSGNLAAEFFALWVDPAQHPLGTQAHRTLTLLDGVLEQVRRHPSELALCTSPAELLAAHTAGRFAILLGIEGGHSIENSLALLRIFHLLGVRYMTLTWANSNDWAESSGDLRTTQPGLTGFGREVIAEMNRLGMMIDLSHASDQTFWDTLSVTRAPVLASHSCARALCQSPRNLTDDQLRALAAQGGVCMVNFYSAFVEENCRLAQIAQRPEREAAHARQAAEYSARNQPIPFAASNAIDQAFAARIPRPPLSCLIDQFDHILQVAGIDHVGIGSDFDGISSMPEGIDSAADLAKITVALAERGYSAEALSKVLGGNLLRVFAEVQAAAL